MNASRANVADFTRPDQLLRPVADGLAGSRAADVARVALFAAGWPHRAFLGLAALPSAVPRARQHTRQVLWEWGLADFSENTELLVAELTTNAVPVSRAAAQDEPIGLWLVSDRMQVIVMVWDASPLPPVPVTADADSENGRGLLLVEAVSERWDWALTPDIGGKVVWAQTLRE